MTGEAAGRRGPYVGGLLLAAEELSSEPLHVAVVGRRSDPVARALFTAALRAPTAYALVEWWDPQAGAPPRGDFLYPRLARPAAYLCANGACSAPVFDPAALSARIARVTAAPD
jgi:uncharacterized protein YyaL (SSP411 family)